MLRVVSRTFSEFSQHCRSIALWITPMFRIALLALALSTASAAHADARADLNVFTKGLKGLSGSFSQQVFDAKGGLKERSSGTVALAAPKQFRWQYLKPYPQLIVADGRKVWIHDPDLEQVTVKPQSAEEQANPLAALVDPKQLDAQFLVKDAGTSNGFNWLTLAPKGKAESGFRTARLGFNKSGLARMQVVDALGQRTDLSFSGWKRNPTLPASTFRFVAPKGVDVIGEG